MSGQHESPWARPAGDAPGPVVITPAPALAPASAPAPASHAAVPVAAARSLGAGRQPVGGTARWSDAGLVTRGRAAPPPPPDVLDSAPPRSADAAARRTLLWFGGGAAALVAIGVVVLLALVMTGHSPLGQHRAAGPPDVLPPLAKACPPPSGDPHPAAPAPPAPAGPRTTDPDSGISYARYGDPWQPWDELWDAGDLHVRYGVGQHFITEEYAGGEYHASILSGSVPAAENDALTLDLKCTGHQVLADVRSSYYPQPNTIDMLRDEVTSLGGRPAWLATFRLHFHESGLRATSELVGLGLIDVGRPNAAIIYVSIPNTVGQYDPLVDQVLASVRPA